MRENIRLANIKKITEFKKRFLEIPAFPALHRIDTPKPENALLLFNHTAYLIFIRAKFLFLAILETTTDAAKNKNGFAAFVLLKAYWETVAALGYTILVAKPLIANENYTEIFNLAKRMGLGGKQFPSKKMLSEKGLTAADFTIPNVLTMMDRVDRDWDKIFSDTGKTRKSAFREEYDLFIAEAGHPTYFGLHISGRWLNKKSALLPDIQKCWEKKDKNTINNYVALSSLIFFYYWDQFMDLKIETKP